MAAILPSSRDFQTEEDSKVEASEMWLTVVRNHAHEAEQDEDVGDPLVVGMWDHTFRNPFRIRVLIDSSIIEVLKRTVNRRTLLVADTNISDPSDIKGMKDDK